MYTVGDYSLLGRITCSKNFFKHPTYSQLPIALLILLLKGGTIVEKNSTNKKIEQKVDYTVLGTSLCVPKQLSSYLLQITTKNSQQKLYENFPFYKTILVEFCACLYAEEFHSGITSLLHIYRILERISYALPLIYAKNSEDYRHTYDMFKSFFDSSDTKIGELGFFKQSLNTILDPTEKDFLFSYEINVSEKNSLLVCFKKQDIFYQNGNIINFELSILDTIDLLINIRNSFFHALSGKHHISLEKLIDPDKTFSKITCNFINVLGFIISKITEPVLLP